MLEVSEQYAIENYTLFVEALQNFTQMGFQVAVDDIGAGYSGLEKVAHLNPHYLKFDMQLVRDIDASYIRREMARALKIFADKMDSKIIAEGSSARASARLASTSGSTTGRATCWAARESWSSKWWRSPRSRRSRPSSPRSGRSPPIATGARHCQPILPRPDHYPGKGRAS